MERTLTKLDFLAKNGADEALTKMYDEGLTPTAIARVLDSMKISTKKQKLAWHHQTVIGILKREGLYQLKRKRRIK